MLFCVAIVVVFPSMSLGAVTTCPSGYTTVNESDAIYVSNTGSCSAGHTQLGGDMDLKNCYTSPNAPMCTYYDEIYTAVYNCNGGSGDTSESVTYGNTFTPKTNVCTRANYEFDGWTIDGTDVGSSFTWSYLSDKTLTARWKQVSCDDGKMLIDGECVFEPEFIITTTDTSDFSFKISAAGTYYLDCGNGEGVRTINKTSTDVETITCANRTGNTIGLSGQATDYSSDYVGAISFANNTKIKSVDGSLGAIFGGSSNYMFRNTFADCTSLTSIPENLFAGVSGSAYYMFYGTFSGCTSLTSIPGNLFAGLSGSAGGLFNYTFSYCTSLTSIPENLFAGVSGSAEAMFYYTFGGCTSLTTIPENLFAGVSGSADYMFNSTFNGCNSLRGYIPANTFPSSDVLSVSTMSDTFANTTLDEVCPSGTYQYITGFESAWSGKVSCAPCPNGVCYTATQCGGDAGVGEKRCYYDATTNDYTKCDDTCVYTSCNDDYTLLNGTCVKFEPEFTITTTSTTSSFSFQISAAGNYTISWGDGNVEQISKSDVTLATYSHNYNTAGKYEINISGQATGYNTDVNTPSVSFSQNKNIAKISGSLGAIFGTLSNGDNPRFKETFYACTNMSGPIPADLFAGITGNPTKRMFTGLFSDCSSLSGEIPADLFSGLTGAVTEYMFNNTFYNCKKLTGGIPSGLFRVTGTPQMYMFYQTFRGCTGLTGTIGDGLFAGIKGAPAKAMFQDTFSQILPRDGGTDMNLTGSIPANLFAGISGAPASMMFFNTFYGCSKLSGAIPGDLFKGIKGQLNGTQAFQYTFEKCAGLTGYIPSELFAGVTYSGTYPTTGKGDMRDIFNGATGLATSCAPYGLTEYVTVFKPDWSGKVSCFSPEFTIKTINMTAETSFSFKISAAGNYMIDWGDGSAIKIINKTDVSVLSVSHTYDDSGTYTIGMSGDATAYATDVNTAAISFESNTNIKEIYGSLGAIFGTLSNGDNPRFRFTFGSCSNLDSNIPSELFDGVYGNPSKRMFQGLFNECTSLTGNIPADLFAGLTGAVTEHMFRNTFYNCKNLTGKIPSDLFRVTGTPQTYMFYQTFRGCTGLTGQIPPKLFWGITGMPASNMYYGTFQSCTGLTGNVPVELFGRINNTNYQSGPMTNVFYDSGIKTTCPDGMIQYHTGFDIDFSDRKACWKPEFVITTSDMAAGTTFRFSISAIADYTIDWGDGTRVEAYSKNASDYEVISHTYANAGTYTIGLMANNVTGYANPNIGEQYSAISFSDAAVTTNTACSYIKGISGSLGAMFPTLSDGTQPSFRAVFKGCNKLEGNIPSDLFDGVTGQPVKYMFQETFGGCSKLTGKIPSDLFADISGRATDHLFYGLFQNCAGLTGEIPGDLFKNITGGDELSSFSLVFQNCIGLTGEIPENLFAGLNSHPGNRVFAETFSGCSGLTGAIPSDLFASMSGTPEEYAFYMTFAGCSGLTGEIPSDLFATVGTTEPQQYTFYGTFKNCSGLTGEIPSDLFAGVKGAPAQGLFTDTFENCSGLTGSIPADLFAGIKGAPARRMFEGTFKGDTGLTGTIPATLFKGISGAAAPRMFEDTFRGCTGLSGYVPAELFGNITDFNHMSMPTTFYGASGILTSCPAGMYQHILGVEEDWGKLYNDDPNLNDDNRYTDSTYVGEEEFKKVVCMACPTGTTSLAGSVGEGSCNMKTKILHIKNNTIQLTPNKPASSPVMAFRVNGKTYYGGLSDTARTLNDTTETKYNVLYRNKHYYLYDATLQ